MIRVPLCLLADSANVSQEGKLNILGIFEHIMSAQFPASHPTMALVFTVEGDTGDTSREHDLSIDLIDSDGKRLANLAGKLKFSQITGGKARTNQVIFFNGLTFPQPGEYEFKIIINGEERSHVSISLKKIETEPKQSMFHPEEVLKKMRVSKDGWGPGDLRRLYESFGFVGKEGSKHTVYKHPQYPFLRATVARHNKLAVGYVQDAVSLIDKLKELESKHAKS